MTRGQKALVALVVAMGVLIVLGTTALIVVVVHRLAHPRPEVEAGRLAGPVLAATDGVATLGEPAGTRITALTALGGDELAVALTGGGRPDRVVVWSRSTGRRVGTVTVAPDGVTPR